MRPPVQKFLRADFEQEETDQTESRGELKCRFLIGSNEVDGSGASWNLVADSFR
jgi:hypothetical protein